VSRHSSQLEPPLRLSVLFTDFAFLPSQWMDSAYAMKMFEGEVWPKAGADGRIENAQEAIKARGV
jgi:hypothetical protein